MMFLFQWYTGCYCTQSIECNNNEAWISKKSGEMFVFDESTKASLLHRHGRVLMHQRTPLVAGPAFAQARRKAIGAACLALEHRNAQCPVPLYREEASGVCRNPFIAPPVWTGSM